MKASVAAQRERHELADLMDAVGPEAPTLCEGWNTRDLAVHLVMRERRPDAAVGIIVKPLSGYTEKVERGFADRGYAGLVGDVRNGPPTVSIFGVPGMDGLANLFEYAIHHEDVRRAIPDWQPRELPAGEQDLIWSRLAKGGRLLARSCPTGLALRRTDTGETCVIKKGSPMVVLVGEPLEMLLRLYGRKAVRLQVEGDESAVAAFESGSFGI